MPVGAVPEQFPMHNGIFIGIYFGPDFWFYLTTYPYQAGLRINTVVYYSIWVKILTFSSIGFPRNNKSVAQGAIIIAVNFNSQVGNPAHFKG